MSVCVCVFQFSTQNILSNAGFFVTRGTYIYLDDYWIKTVSFLGLGVVFSQVGLKFWVSHLNAFGSLFP